MISGKTDYDTYWDERDVARAEARSRVRARLALSLLGERRGRLLEVGCGPGWALEEFARAGFDGQGIDVSGTAAARARDRGLDVRVADLVDPDELAAAVDGTFDTIVALEFLEHVIDPLAIVERLRAHLADDGRFVISLPNEWHLLRRLGALFGRPGFGGHDDPHVRHFDVDSARRFFRAARLDSTASRWDSVVPPRWAALRQLGEPLAQLAPSLFALSGVHVLRLREDAEDPSREGSP